MAIIYTYPQINSSSDLAASDLMIISDMSANGRPTKSLTLKDLADFVTSTGTGTGTTNKIIKWSDGPGGLLGDSIMTENATQIDLAGTFLSTSSPTVTQAAPVSGIKSVLAATASAPHVALYGDSKHTGATQANSNYGVYAKGEFEGTGGFTNFIIGGNLEARYDGSGANGANASMYGVYNLARATSVANGTVSYMIGANTQARVESANVTATNLQGQHTSVELTNGTAGDVIVNLLDFDGTGGTVTNDFSYLQIQNDTMPTVNGTARAINSKSVLPSLFQGQVEIPLVPTINAHATSKQYVDQQIASIPAGLVFQGNWNASTNTPTLASGTGTVGNYYVVSVAGNTDLDGITDWEVGDWAVFVEVGGVDKWDKIDQTFVQGAGATGQVSFWNGVNSVTGDNDLYWDNSNKRLGVGTTTPDVRLHVDPTLKIGDRLGTNGSLIIQSQQGPNITFTSIGDSLVVSGSTGSPNGNTISLVDEIKTLRFDNGIGGTISIERGNRGLMDSNIGGYEVQQQNTTGSNGKSTFLSTDTGGTILRSSSYGGTGTSADIQFQFGGGDNVNEPAPTTKMIVKNNGNVGIGTTSPDSLLEISSGTTTDFLKLTSTGSNASPSKIIFEKSATEQGIVEYVRNGDLRIYNTDGDGGVLIDGSSASGNDLYVKNDGNVGVGTTNPSEKLHIAQDGNASIELERTTAVVNPGSSRITVANNGQLGISSDNLISFKTSGASGGTERMRIANNGNVGIGTTSPAAGLQVAKGSSTVPAAGASTASACFGNNVSGDDYGVVLGADTSGSGYISAQRTDGTATAYNLYLQPNGGNVGIGTTSPAEKLSLPDDAKISLGSGNDLKIYHNSTSQNGIIENFTNDLIIQNNADNEDIVFKCDNGSGGVAEYFRIDGSSEITIVSKPFRFFDSIAAQFGNGLDMQLYHSGGEGTFFNYTGNLRFIQGQDDGDITFSSDDGSGGVTEYFRLDGGDVKNRFSKTVQLGDNVYFYLGDQQDLGMFHNGTSTVINNNTGDLTIKNSANDKDIIFQSDDGSGGTTNYLKLWGAIESLAVYKDMLFVNDGNGGKLKFGASQDLQIYHDGSDSYINETGTGDLIVKAIDDVYIRGNTHDMGRFNEQGVKFYYLGNVKLETNNTGVKIPTAGNGLQLVSPNGTVYTVTVDNSGNLVVT